SIMCPIDQQKTLITIVFVDRILTRIQEMIFHHTQYRCFLLIDKIVRNNYKNKINEDHTKQNISNYKLNIYEKNVYRMLHGLLEDENFVMNLPMPIGKLIKFQLD